MGSMRGVWIAGRMEAGVTHIPVSNSLTVCGSSTVPDSVCQFNHVRQSMTVLCQTEYDSSTVSDSVWQFDSIQQL